VGTSRYFRITTDLSTFGLSTRQGYPHQLGTRLRLRIYLPDGIKEPVEINAEVVGVFSHESQMRLAFRDPPIEAVRRIHRYLLSRTRADRAELEEAGQRANLRADSQGTAPLEAAPR
jgi:hypothetical protein